MSMNRPPVETIIFAAKLIRGKKVMTSSAFRKHFRSGEISPVSILIKHGIMYRIDGFTLAYTGEPIEPFIEWVQTCMVCMDNAAASMVLATTQTSEAALFLDCSVTLVQDYRKRGTVDYPMPIANSTATAGAQNCDRVLEYVKENPTCRMTDIAKGLRMNHGSLFRLLNRMVDAGRIIRHDTGRHPTYTITEGGS